LSRARSSTPPCSTPPSSKRCRRNRGSAISRHATAPPEISAGRSPGRHSGSGRTGRC
jgi:hypothetical protein